MNANNVTPAGNFKRVKIANWPILLNHRSQISAIISNNESKKVIEEKILIIKTRNPLYTITTAEIRRPIVLVRLAIKFN